MAATPQRFLVKDANFIEKLNEFTTERLLPNKYRFADIFNDTSVHSFEKVAELPESFWTAAGAEPKYDDQIELITRQLTEI